MHEEMMVGFRRRRTQGRSGWGTPRPSPVASEVVSSRLVVAPAAAAYLVRHPAGTKGEGPDLGLLQYRHEPAAAA
jgi:hypothetical protein